ncbi:cache domain-containing sensor histidine kinase [Paenibacillus turpanensis]|uniref:cache domain-containing sensor histidine kinase n=1 Tax=Paenibacillus turpanensis TaxID=2689078 RepID=UPI00140A4081|nr:sensor histidine kinase [Paenibacillus turpanensis]
MKLIGWVSSSLRAKLMTMFVILTCVPLIAVGLISYQKSYNTVFDNSKSSTMLTAEQLAHDIDNLFTDTSKLLELGKNPHVLHFLFSQNDAYDDAKEILRTISSYRQTYKYESVLNITMINLYGRGISERKGVFQLARNPLRNPHFEELVKHPDAVLNISPAEASPLDRLDGFDYGEQGIISIMAAVKQRSTHEVIGFIVIDVDNSVVKRFCDTVKIGETGFFHVVDPFGTAIFTPSFLSAKQPFFDPDRMDDLLEQPGYHFIDRTEGKPKFVFAASSKTTGWSIIGQVPLQEIVQEANAIRQLIIISVTLSIVFAVSLHFYISKRLTRPVQSLKNKMQLAASGYLESKVIPAGQDEIADLGRSFNLMIDKIKTLLEQSIKEQEEKKKSELRALQAQINPHFLYNTLDSIVWMAEAGKNDRVIELVKSLSRLFRISLSKGRDWITLEKELEHVHSYLVIQQLRYRDILDYEINVDASLYGCPMLKMTLQPIVENAIYHGIKNKRGKGLIRIGGKPESSQTFVLTVEDNGIGIPQEVLERLRADLEKGELPEETGKEVSGGFGLHNVQQRIRLFYGEWYGVHIESTLQQGTTVTIRIPTRGGKLW